MPNLKKRLTFLTVPAVVALAAVSYGSVVAFASPSPSVEPAESTSAAETSEPNEPALPGGGYADSANTQADTQQDGIY